MTMTHRQIEQIESRFDRKMPRRVRTRREIRRGRYAETGR